MRKSNKHIFTSEAVSEGHPDKVADLIADALLDAFLAGDTRSRVAIEVLVKSGTVVVAGEVTSRAKIDIDQIVRHAVRHIGYTDQAEPFCADNLEIIQLLTEQSPEISIGVENGGEQGAGDQGIMFGYATDETPEMMPLPILLAHRLARGIAEDRKAGAVLWLRPDGKTQVSVEYIDGAPRRVTTVLVSTQHSPSVTHGEISRYVADVLAPRVLGEWFSSDIEFLVNPSGSFTEGGPSADCGLTGRKIIVDTYGGYARHGGGAFSGKDPSKVDRSGAYFCRYVARQIVLRGFAKRAEVQVSYAIGQAQPISVFVETFGTGDPRVAEAFVSRFDFRPAAIIERLGLLAPIYRQTTNYGHFGKPELPWETLEIDGWPAFEPATATDLDDAYHSSTFGVETDSGFIYIRPSVESRMLDCLLEERQAEKWAYITAHNPGSRPLTARENAERHERLLRHVVDHGFEYLHGRGVGDAGDWPPEESLFILDISEERAIALGASFGQNAIVFGSKGGAPQLLCCLPRS